MVTQPAATSSSHGVALKASVRGQTINVIIGSGRLNGSGVARSM